MSNLFDNINFTFSSFIDIILVSVFVYYILYPLKGTRSARIALGIVMLILLYYISDRFQLQTMAWLLRNFLAYIVIAIIVIFQADIRKALASFGRNPFLDFFYIREQQPSDFLSELQKAVIQLARNKAGALLVIEREIELKDLDQTGVELDAEISSDILLTIFDTHTPLHDGAVIISGGRISSAAAILPLSSRSDIDKEYGTRHRAALGLSEESDAIVIVVSEERGTVALALNGKLHRLDTALELERRLKPLLARS